MNRFKKNLIQIMDEYKCKKSFEPLKCIPVYDSDMVHQGLLRPITQDYKFTIPDCASLLAKWRNENADMSPDPFVATPESTEKWLDHAILERKDRILFLILSPEGTKIGQIGFSSLDEKAQSMEIDAVIRGEKNGCPGIMSHAMNSLMRWGLDTLELKKITLRVLSTNLHAIQFYKRNFFFKSGEIPLYQAIGSDQERWTAVKQNTDQAAEKFYTKMQLDVEKWRKQHNFTEVLP
nr:GNAT family N-acetyltransferase [uncultured Caproiciproducens sp.]